MTSFSLGFNVEGFGLDPTDDALEEVLDVSPSRQSQRRHVVCTLTLGSSHGINSSAERS